VALVADVVLGLAKGGGVGELLALALFILGGIQVHGVTAQPLRSFFRRRLGG